LCATFLLGGVVEELVPPPPVEVSWSPGENLDPVPLDPMTAASTMSLPSWGRRLGDRDFRFQAAMHLFGIDEAKG
jgi:hypothetical protein